MSRLEFMSELESLLQDISPEEREAAIKYYEDYFEDAGSETEGAENEQKIIEELGTPAKVAAIIKKDLMGARDEYQEGAYTENGYIDGSEEKEKYSVYHTGSNQNESQGNDKKTGKQDHNEANRKQSNIILIILLCVFGIPIGIPIVCSLFGIAIGIIASIFGIFISFFVTAAALLLVGIILLVLGFGQIITVPAAGLIFIGTGLILLGIGTAFGIFSVWLCSKVLPSFVKWVISICKKPFQKKREVA